MIEKLKNIFENICAAITVLIVAVVVVALAIKFYAFVQHDAAVDIIVQSIIGYYNELFDVMRGIAS